MLLAKARAEGSEEESVVLVKSLQSREEQLQLDFRREADMFAKLSHANVARLLGVCREAEPHYTVMEYCDLVRHSAGGGGWGACVMDRSRDGVTWG